MPPRAQPLGQRFAGSSKGSHGRGAHYKEAIAHLPETVQEQIFTWGDEGCLAVEMEAEVFFAVAQFRKVTFAQVLYGGDDVGSSEWSGREWNTHSVRDTLFWLAPEICPKL